MRIAFIAPYPASAVLPEEQIKPKYRGREHPAPWVISLARALSYLPETRVRIVAESRSIRRSAQARVEALEFHFLAKMEPIRSDPFHGYLPSYLRTTKVLASFKPDIVVGFGTENGAGPVASLMPYPRVLFIQGLIDRTMPFRDLKWPRAQGYLYFEHACVNRMDGVVGETAFAARWAVEHAPHAFVRVIPHAMTMDFLTVRPSYGSKLIFCASTLHAIKGVDTVLRALALCRDRAVRLRLAGDGPQRAQYEALAQSLGVRERVDFLGQIRLDEVPRHMAEARFLVLGSRMDTSPNIVTEAHAAGLPVVATRAGGIPDMVDDGQDGLLVAVDDSAAMAAAMEQLLADETRCGVLGEAGRNKVRALNDPHRVAEQHLEFYREILERRARRATPAAGGHLRQWPTIRRAAGLLPVHLRMGENYWTWRRRLVSAREWPRERIADWQLRRMQDLVRYAYERTEGYHELYRKAGVQPDDLRTQADVLRLPTITKFMLQDNLEAFSVPGVTRRYGTTGGSTGIPTGFYYQPGLREIESAFMHDGWSWTGWRLGLRSAVLRGGFVGTPEQVWQYDPYYRELRLSSYQLTEDTLPLYLEALRKYRPRVLQAYPSALNVLCDLLRGCPAAAGLSFAWILLGSENVYAWQLAKVEQAFPHARLFAWYGQAEQVVLAPWCERTRAYHARPFYGYTEVLDERGQPVAAGDEGEIVGTNFHNLATPLIRYRTMDRAVMGVSPCTSCHRPYPVLERITGRAQEVIVTGSGRYISMTAINMHDGIFDALRQFQFRQEKAGEVEFRYVLRRPMTDSEKEAVRRGLAGKLGSDVVLRLVPVEDIPRTSAGKFRFLDQRLPIRYGDRPTEMGAGSEK